MSVLFVLLLVSLLVALGFLGAFLWAMNAGQFDDTVTPSWRVLAEDEGKEAGENDFKTQRKEQGRQ